MMIQQELSAEEKKRIALEQITKNAVQINTDARVRLWGHRAKGATRLARG